MVVKKTAGTEQAGKENPMVDLGTMHFSEANKAVREALEKADAVDVYEACAQRYLGCGITGGKSLRIFGVPGNDLACYMDGGSVEVFGNAQDQVGNTMNDGAVVVHGRSGDAVGYGMRGGEIFIRDDCGWRVGIHMKQYLDQCPTIVIGGDAGSFLGEYMAGGVILLLGKPGDYLATGMHGGVIYLRHRLAEDDIPEGLFQEPAGEKDRRLIADLLERYNAHFASDLANPQDIDPERFYCLKPTTSRPYASMYAS